MSDTRPEPPAPAVPRPRRVAVAALLTGLEGAVVAGLGLVMLGLALLGEPNGLVQAVTGALTVLVLAVLPLTAGHGLWRLRRWSRGPAVVVQILALPTAWHMGQIGGEWRLAAVPVAVLALAILGCLVNPVAAEALGVGVRPDTTEQPDPDADGQDGGSAPTHGADGDGPDGSAAPATRP